MNTLKDLSYLSTESANRDSKSIDTLGALDIVKIINNQDKTIADAVEKCIETISIGAQEISNRFNNGGRIIYIGAGSSGRIGVLDAVELQPTYNVPNTRAFGIIAGGVDAMFQAIEGVEDRYDLGEEDILNVKINPHDVVIGIAASGRTPYTLGGLDKAKACGAYTIGITNNSQSDMSKIVDCSIEVCVGAEVVSGSTRMKAGTAQKMVVNMLSTTAMILSGKVYENYMVYVQSTNKKLVQRSAHIIQEITGLTYEDAYTLFEKANHSVACALVMELAGVSLEAAQATLEQEGGNVRQAVLTLSKQTP